ncbi:hypothetical protein GQ600_4285 [Phytophthora cactorum]|nr:hypothetical protein GQ600_4285 [Phytophthora cactorum]
MHLYRGGISQRSNDIEQRTKRAKKWISELDITVDVPPPYRIELEAIPILAEKMHVVDFACRYQLGDTALMEAMSKLFGPRPDVIIVDPPIWGVVE